MFTFRRLRASYISTVQKSAEIMQTVLVDVDHLNNNYHGISEGVKEINSIVKQQSK
jgi:methyl-accepting chemotaxis protein